MFSDFWLTILLAIPLAIAANLVTPWFQGRIELLGKKRALAISNNTKAELGIIPLTQVLHVITDDWKNESPPASQSDIVLQKRRRRLWRTCRLWGN